MLYISGESQLKTVVWDYKQLYKALHAQFIIQNKKLIKIIHSRDRSTKEYELEST